MRITLTRLIIGVVILCSCVMGKTEEPPAVPDETTYTITVPNFLAQEPVTFDQIVEIVKTRDQFVRNLLTQFASKDCSLDNKVLISYLFASFKTSEAVPLLLEIIETPYRSASDHYIKYPMEGALIAIGKPACNEIYKRIPSENDNMRRILMAFVLRAVDGSACAIERIRALAKDEKDEKILLNCSLAIIDLGGDGL